MSLIEPFTWPFMQTALVAAILVGCSCSLLGVYVVQRRMAFIGDALAHTTLPGIAVAFLVGVPLSVGAVGAGVLTAMLISWLSRGRTLQDDTAIGIVFTGMFALGVVIVSRTKTTRDLTHILLGNVLAVEPFDVLVMASVFFVCLCCVILLHKELELTTYDPIYAESVGLKADRVRFVLLILLALTVVTAIQVVGLILTTALLLTPATAAGLFTKRISHTMFAACGITVVCSVVGLWASYHFRVPAGASIVLAAVAVLLLGMAIKKGILNRPPH